MKPALTIQMGERDTFDRVFGRFYAPLCQFATKYLSEQADAEDVVETLFMRLWSKQEVFEDDDHVRAVLYRSTYHACLNHLRGRSRSLLREEHYVMQEGEMDDTYLPNLLKVELIALIYREIDKLPIHYATVLKLSYQDELKNEEIAQKLQLSIQTVKNYKNKGLSLLKKRIPQDAFMLLVVLGEKL